MTRTPTDIRICRRQGLPRSSWRRYSARRARRTGPWPLAVRLTAGHGAGDERQRPRPGHFDAVNLPACIRARPRIRARALGMSLQKTGRLRSSPPRRGRTWLPGASAPCPGITLSDASEQEERAHSRLITSPLSGVSHVALRTPELRGGHIILSGVSDAAGSCVTHVTCLYPLVAAAFEFWPRPERHVNDMSLTQNRCPTRAYTKWT
jgi:hypothetical protein